MSQTILEPEQLGASTHAKRWKVVIFNNDTNSFDDVIGILIQATGCDLQEAMIETWEADTYGHADVHFANQDECRGAAKVISSIGVKTEVCPEWDD
jgi:ATP-dependent Clp protease adaptor protein ClpS